jgi:hypothetical protein
MRERRTGSADLLRFAERSRRRFASATRATIPRRPGSPSPTRLTSSTRSGRSRRLTGGVSRWRSFWARAAATARSPSTRSLFSRHGQQPRTGARGRSWQEPAATEMRTIHAPHVGLAMKLAVRLITVVVVALVGCSTGGSEPAVPPCPTPVDASGDQVGSSELPSGSCGPDSVSCQATTLYPCPGGTRGPVDLWSCSCDAGTWRCTRIAQTVSVCPPWDSAAPGAGDAGDSRRGG